MAEFAEHRRRGRPAALSQDERRQLVLDALGRAYDDSGHAGLTMEAVAKTAGMSKRTLYSLFEDRGALFIAYFDRVGRDFIRELTPGSESLPLADRLTQMLEPRPICPAPLPIEILRCIIAEAPERPDMASEFHRKVRGRAIEMVRAELDRAVAEGEAKCEDTGLVAALLLDMIKPNVLDLLMDPESYPDIDARRLRFHFALDLAMRGISL